MYRLAIINEESLFHKEIHKNDLKHMTLKHMKHMSLKPRGS